MKIRRPVLRSSLVLLSLMPAAAMAQLPGADELNSPAPVERSAAPVEQPAAPVEQPDAAATTPVVAESTEVAAPAPERDARFVSASLNLEGGVGLQHLEAAWGGVSGTYRVALLGQFFSGTDVIRYNDENTFFGGNLLLEASPIDFLSVHARIQTRNNVNSFGRPEAMLSQGDFSLGVKGFYPVADGVTLGGDLGFFVPTDFGSTGLTFDGLSVRPRFLASVDFAEMLQSDVFLKTHFNLGYRVDRSENTVPDGVVPTRVERFAYGLSAYDALEVGLGVEYDFPYVSPFLEWNLAVPVNGADGVCDQANLACAGDAGFGSYPNVLALGLRAEPVENLGLHAGVDFGLTSDDAAGLPVTAPWQLVFGLQWTIDPRPKIEYVEKEAEKVETAIAEAFVLGVVTDRESALPVEGATVRYPMGNETAQLTDATGSFRSYGYAPGSTVRFAISHPDYEAVDVDRTLPAEAGDHELRVQLKAVPRTGNIQGGVTDEKGNAIAGSTITISGTESKTLSPDLSGKFKVALKAGDYSVGVSAPGYLTRGKDIKVEATKTLDMDFVLKAEPRESLVTLRDDKIEILQTVYFETGKATILPKSFPLLEQVSSVMSANPQIKRVVIGGHTDDVGADEFNLELSQKRAESVRQFLIDQGVGGDRLMAKGFGETQPLLPNTSTRNRGVNRRVEFKITDR